MNPSEPRRHGGHGGYEEVSAKAVAPGTTVTIDRLELDLRGVPPAVARAAVDGLGPAIARALAARGASGGRLDTSNAPITSGTPLTAVGLQAAIAARVAGAIAPALRPPHARGGAPEPLT